MFKKFLISFDLKEGAQANVPLNGTKKDKKK